MTTYEHILLMVKGEHGEEPVDLQDPAASNTQNDTTNLKKSEEF